MPRAPGELTTIAGGGADRDAAATWKLDGGRLTSMTDGPEMSPGWGATAASGMTSASWVGGRMTGAGAGAPATAPANTTGATTKTNAVAGVRATRVTRWRTRPRALRAPEPPPSSTHTVLTSSEQAPCEPAQPACE